MLLKNGHSKTKLTMPVLAVGAGYDRIGGNITMSSIEYRMKQLAQNVTGIIAPNSALAYYFLKTRKTSSKKGEDCKN